MLHNSLLRKFSSIRLSDQEANVFSSLLAASEALGKGTVLRAAGGWVRDKLMGGDSCDIDIALDNVPGDEFALFLYEREKETCSTIGIVKENPSQSKHIRTASFRFHGLDLDVNNLRSETYTEDSRIPEVSFATHPSEDAMRRDFTMNALYYNLNTKEVEDFTGTGLSDLSEGLVRTPLPARQTFIDDPLRVLRAIRFATRFGFRLDPDIIEAWKDGAVREGLMNKVSRERIGTEIMKMMTHPTGNAVEAINLLHTSGLLSKILSPPSELTSLAGVGKKEYDQWVASMLRTSALSTGTLVDRLIEMESIPLTEGRETLFLSVLFSESVDPLLVARMSMKLSNRDCKDIHAVLSSIESMRACWVDNGIDKVKLGRLIRNSLKDLYPVSILLSLLSSDSDFSLIQYTDMMDQVRLSGLDKCYEWKPVLGGSEIQQLLDIKPGKIIQELVNLQYDLMFEGLVDRDMIIAAITKYYEKHR